MKQLIASLLFLTMSFASCNRSAFQAVKPFAADGTDKYFDSQLNPFYHGVASGDPTQNEVIIWTRVTPAYDKPAKIYWRISLDSTQANIIQQGSTTTDSTKDFTVKILLTSLSPDTYYWYSFSYEGKKSVVGRTKTLPEKTDSLRLIFVSCNAYEAGYFNSYELIGKKKEKIDAIVHLGDYIYEGFLPKYFEIKERVPLPEKECVQLKDYRTRYAQYRLDKQLQMAHQRHPFIHIWDDHEIVNDAYRDGSPAHDPESEGSYEERKAKARQAFYEWLPIKESDKHFRQFNFGGLVELFMLDGRLEGRTEQQSPKEATFQNQERHLLGPSQLNWVLNGIKNSKAIWKVIANPVLFADFNFSPVLGNMANRKTDSWSGYPSERRKMLESITANKIDNLLFFSGDSHCSWAFEIRYPEMTGRTVALELGVPSITSGNWDSKNPVDTVLNWEKALYNHPDNKHIKYANLGEHGYIESLFSKNEVQGEWHFIIKDRFSLGDRVGQSYLIKENKITLK